MFTYNDFGVLTVRNDKGQLHNENGPAVAKLNGECQFWLNGIQYEFNDYINELCGEEIQLF